jgi:nucleotide-binding universal stress UspA family protein
MVNVHSISLPFKRILCPVDFDRNSIAALDIALKLAERERATVSILYVAPVSVVPPSVDFPPGWQLTVKTRLEKIARERLDFAVPYETLIRTGDPAPEIAKAAEESDVDLIVMATHGRGGVPRLLLGSVADAVMRQSNRPLMIVRPQPDDAPSG